MLTAYIILRFRVSGTGPFLPDAYLLGIVIYTIGVTYISIFGYSIYADEVAVIAYTTLISAIIGNTFFLIIFGPKYKYTSFINSFIGGDTGPIEKSAIYFGLLFSMFICLIFIYAVFSNQVVSAFLSPSSLLDGSSLLNARKAITSGVEGYFAPGYIKQFRDILIPIFLVSIMASNSTIKPKGLSRFMYFGAIAVVLIAMLITGQRSILVILFLVLLVARVYVLKANKLYRQNKDNLKIPNLFLIIFSAVIFFWLITLFLGRLGEDGFSFNAMFRVFSNLISRVFFATPGENISTYDYWGAVGPTNGQSWLNELSSILPGIKPFGLSNQLHSLIGGSKQGNSPLGLPADIWFAWGWPGVIFIPFIYSIAIGIFDLLTLSRKSAILAGVKIYMFIALLQIYSPFGFILYGGIASLILIVFIVTIKKIPHKTRVPISKLQLLTPSKYQ